MFQYRPSEGSSKCDCKFCNYVQIPSLPLRGPKPFDQILCDIHKSIVDEATAIDFYCHLLKDAPNKLHRDFIESIIDDERIHLQILTKLYCYYTDEVPPYKVIPVCYPCYKDGLLMAMTGELETVLFYRNMQLITMDQLIIDTYFMIMVDEQNHATVFSTLFNTCR